MISFTIDKEEFTQTGILASFSNLHSDSSVASKAFGNHFPELLTFELLRPGSLVSVRHGEGRGLRLLVQGNLTKCVSVDLLGLIGLFLAIPVQSPIPGAHVDVSYGRWVELCSTSY